MPAPAGFTSFRQCRVRGLLGRALHTHIHTQWHATDMLQPLAISVISPVDISAVYDAERPLLSDARQLCHIRVHLTGEYLVDVSVKLLRSVLWNSLYVPGMIKARQGSSLGLCACCPCPSTSLRPWVDCQWQAQRYAAHPHMLFLFHIPFRLLYLTPTHIIDITRVPPTTGGPLHYSKGDLAISVRGNVWTTLGVGNMADFFFNKVWIVLYFFVLFLIFDE